MNIRNTFAMTAVLIATAASADISTPSAIDPGIYVPFDNAEVTIVWESSSAGYTGEVHMVDNSFEGAPIMLWDNHSATQGQEFTAQRLFDAGERIDFTYDVVTGGIDTFSTANESDWQQFRIDASDPNNITVGVEDIRYPQGDMDHNDAVFHVVFTPATVPAPGALALLAAGGGLCARRRR